MARIQVDTAQLTSYDITQVTVEASGIVETLTRDSSTGVFTGTLMLPVGTHDLIARAYEDMNQVGESSPTQVDIQAGVVTQVSLRILDTTGGNQPDYGPIVESLTYPMSTEAGALVSFAVSVVDPDSDPVAIAWTDDCTDSTFGAPDAATTDWSKATEGSCQVTMTATANGLSVTETFSIVVFAAGSSSGAVNVDGTFISAPEINLGLTYDSYTCAVLPGSSSASCTESIASPSYASIEGFVNWGDGTEGSIEVYDSCGGAVGLDYVSSLDFQGNWLPPELGGVCFVSVRATNGEGVAAILSAAVLVRDGTPREASPPNIWMDVSHVNGACTIESSTSPVTCGQLFVDDTPYMNINVDWVDGLAGSVEVTDDCGGTVELTQQADILMGTWTIPPTPGVVCTLTATATSLEGASSQAIGTFEIF